MEADLQRWYQVDYRDRWRPDGRLTLRRLWVLLSHLPPDSQVMTLLRDGQPHWTVEAHLLDDLRMAMTSSEKKKAKRHPGRPVPKRKSSRRDPQRAVRIAAARARARARRRRKEAGEL